MNKFQGPKDIKWDSVSSEMGLSPKYPMIDNYPHIQQKQKTSHDSSQYQQDKKDEIGATRKTN